MSKQSKCPFHATPGSRTTVGAQANANWWPDRLNLKILSQHSAKSDPMDAGFDYTEAFKTLDLAAVKQDLRALRIFRFSRSGHQLALAWAPTVVRLPGVA